MNIDVNHEALLQAWVRQMHHNQKSKTGENYFDDHLLVVAEPFRETQLYAAALCHDILEDTNVSFEYLKDMIGPVSAAIVQVLTHDESDSYLDYLSGVVCNEGATAIKIADILHNLRGDRLERMDQATQLRLVSKYKKGLKFMFEQSTWASFMFPKLALAINPTLLVWVKEDE